ncbi:acyl-CoA dehydrogenase family protein [Roseitranquillus sediminis]|uniref:acyl-CoA dehydrogenase family protein n=1 Tax=Roseitranquillus sediminis TaxID=2809051 RepID=UPI001D0C5736|nr:acyl-CoA dehydrogenase family protein [Roseitranquillus sediminis]MBM9596295.1 acyl-CoA dehydrogenase family protein [Roseitranquillus sediminis]
MPHDGPPDFAAPTSLLEGLEDATVDAVAAVENLLEKAVARVGGKLGALDPATLEANQGAAHGLAWLATYVQSLRQMHRWATALDADGAFGEMEALILQIAFGEYLAQIAGGIPMNQGEIIRPTDLWLRPEDLDALNRPAPRALIERGNSQEARLRLVALMRERGAETMFGRSGLDDELEMIREQFRRFARERIEPHAHAWHLQDALIPMEVVNEMANLGVFGLTIPEEHGGLGLPKSTMCVVSEELSRGYIGVGSLGTRSEIAAELILGGGTEAQKAHWLPLIASGQILQTAVFTEPNTGSDLGSLRTRAVPDGDGWRITGNKTWITHAARAHLMMVLARTDPATDDYRGLSMFLAEKTPGSDADPFPDPGLSGGEIEVLGYRGMKEYELGFDGFHVEGVGLLGGVEGQGFKQLMRTFESARIQTAARAVGVAQSALDLGLRYAEDRQQFGKPLIEFPRVASKLALMAVEIAVARQLTYHAAQEKDASRRCDLEAGMAKLLAARVAWAAADNALQIHGGNGFAVEYPISRVLCDARILNIFEGAAEIQAQVIARRLLA